MAQRLWCWFPSAFSFEIDYDPIPLRTYLEQSRELGGLDDRSRLAEFIVNAQFLEPSELVEYLNKNSENFDTGGATGVFRYSVCRIDSG